MIEIIKGVFSSALTEIIVAVVLALLGGGGAFAWGRRQRNKGRKEAEHEQTQDTLDRFQKGQDAKRDSDGTPDERVRRNDGQW
jgi:uncharacterized protein HemX